MRFAIVLTIAFIVAYLKTSKSRKMKAEQDLINFWNDIGSNLRLAAENRKFVSQFRMVR